MDADTITTGTMDNDAITTGEMDNVAVAETLATFKTKIVELEAVIVDLRKENAELRKENAELRNESYSRVAELESSELDDDFETKLMAAADEALAAIPFHCDEKHFKTAIDMIMADSGYTIERERRLSVYFRGIQLTDVFCDFFVTKGSYARTVEVKKGKATPNHLQQTKCYASLAGHSFGLLLNLLDEGATIAHVDA